MSKNRIITVHKGLYKVKNNDGEFLVGIRGKLKREGLFPAVGDYVELDSDNSIIEAIHERKSCVSRKVAGNTTEEQVIASNIDYIFIVSSLNLDFNISRMERYLTMVYDSGASPVFILTKADIGQDIDDKVAELEGVAFGVPIHVISSFEGQGLGDVKNYLENGNTIAMVGSSGVGKSTLLNALAHEELAKTKDIRSGDDKGKHTTTHRELFKVEDGFVIDTPGMREIQLWSGDLENSFSDIEELSLQCKFTDCSHVSEPKCAVKKAIEDGRLEQGRFDNYLKLKKELFNIKNKQNLGHKGMEKEKIKAMMGSLNTRKNVNNRHR